MSNLSVVAGNSDPLLVLSATGTGASAITFIHDSGSENNYPGPLFPSVFECAITDIVGVFSALTVNLEWSPITATGTPQFQTVATWTPLASPVAFFPCSATGSYRLNVTSFTGGTSFNVYASIAASMPQGSGGGGGGGSVTQGTVPWVVSFIAPQHVIVDSGAGSGTQYADNAVSGATPTGTLSMGWDSANSKVRALKVDASQNLEVAINAALPAGTNVIGHVIVDSGAVTVSWASAQHIIVDSASAVDVSDRAARLLGVVQDSAIYNTTQVAPANAAQVQLQADMAGNLLVMPGNSSKLGITWNSSTITGTLQYPNGTITQGAPIAASAISSGRERSGCSIGNYGERYVERDYAGRKDH